MSSAAARSSLLLSSSSRTCSAASSSNLMASSLAAATAAGRRGALRTNRPSSHREFGTSSSASSSSKSLLSSSSKKIDRTAQITTPRSPIPFEVQVSRKRSSAKSVASAAPKAEVEAVSDASPGAGSADGATTTDAVEAAEDDIDNFIPPALSNHNLSILHAFTSPAPISALAALANRLALSSSSGNISPSLVSNLPLLEQCLIHESFWIGVKELAAAPLGSKARIYTRFHDTPLDSSLPVASQQYAHNGSLATLGNALLGTLASELLLSSFPHLPTRVTKAALTMYVGPKSLAAVASSWGVGPSRLDRRLVGAEDREKRTTGERAYGHLVGGVGPGRPDPTAKDGAAGMGLIRWNRRPTTPTKDSVLFEDSLASVSRAVIGAIYQIHGFAAARSFVHSQFLSRLVTTPNSVSPSPAAAADISPLLKFTVPSLLLSLTCKRYAMPPSTHQILKESGRLSSHPTFLSGVFSGDRKLGEGFGSSIKMSEWRASEDALRRLYLGGKEKGGLPSDAWVDGKARFEGLKLGEDEVEHDSKERSKKHKFGSSSKSILPSVEGSSQVVDEIRVD